MNAEFVKMMTGLRACYPQPMDPEHWRGMMMAYHSELGSESPEVLISAFKRARVAHPKFFPSLGELMVLVRLARKEAEPLVPESMRLEESCDREEGRRKLAEILGQLADKMEM